MRLPARCRRRAAGALRRRRRRDAARALRAGRASLGGDRVQAAQQQLALAGVDDAVGELDLLLGVIAGGGLDGGLVSSLALRRGHGVRLLCLPMRVHVVDPSAYTPPYDHALCSALARRGAAVELITSDFAYGETPTPNGYRVRELFYRHALGQP